MTDAAPIYREDQRDGAPMTPLRSLSAVLDYLASVVREDLAQGPGACDHLLCQDPPAELAGALAVLLAWSGPLKANIGHADRCLADGVLPEATRYRDPSPEIRVPVQRIREAMRHLADVVCRWCDAAYAQGDAMEEAARLVRCGQATAAEHDGVTTVRHVIAPRRAA
jgi:hypothetical protein